MPIQKLLQDATYEIQAIDSLSTDGLRLIREWQGSVCRIFVVNDSSTEARLAEVIAFRTAMPFPTDTNFYGEGYNMLSQYKGTIEKPVCITSYTDSGHYKLPQKEGLFMIYNLLMLFPRDEVVLMGFSSCHRFSGEIRFNRHTLEVVISCEGLKIAAGDRLELEEFFSESGNHREELLAAFASRIEANHPRLPYPEIPTGWCSWYAYGPNVTEQHIFDNLAEIKARVPQLKFIQIDDGYQKRMGDWLEQHPNFPRPIKDLCLKIKSEGFEPAMWVAPFIAEKDSDLLRDHPEWFVHDENGEPLPSDKDSFGGWRLAPWYMLDGTHPGAQAYLLNVFRTMREEWQCRYFKLDANMWGALPFGYRHDPNATKVDAYRAGMQAVLEGAGPDSFILGCNAPMWPSIGTVHGMRVTGDFSRRWPTIKVLAEEGFNRNWQHMALWMNDPDCLVLQNLSLTLVGPDGKSTSSSTSVTKEEFSFHAAYILASGGMVLGGDRMNELNDSNLSLLKRLLPPIGKAAVFDDRGFQVGRIPVEGGQLLCLFNASDIVLDLSPSLDSLCDVFDFWTGEVLFSSITKIDHLEILPHSARVLKCVRLKGSEAHPPQMLQS